MCVIFEYALKKSSKIGGGGQQGWQREEHRGFCSVVSSRVFIISLHYLIPFACINI